MSAALHQSTGQQSIFPTPDPVIENTSGLHPLGHAVLVRPYEVELKSGLIQIPKNVNAAVQALDQRAVVIEVGPDAWADHHSVPAQPGDHVLVAKFAGWFASEGVTKDKMNYRVVNDRDIFCRIDQVEEKAT